MLRIEKLIVDLSYFQASLLEGSNSMVSAECCCKSKVIFGELSLDGYARDRSMATHVLALRLSISADHLNCVRFNDSLRGQPIHGMSYAIIRSL